MSQLGTKKLCEVRYALNNRMSISELYTHPPVQFQQMRHQSNYSLTNQPIFPKSLWVKVSKESVYC